MKGIKRAANENSPAAIVHFGAGRGDDLDQYLAANPAKILLVEAEPVAAARLAARTAGMPEVKVVAGAVAAVSGKVSLKRFNLPAFNSLREPTGLRTLFPGLRLKREEEVEALAPSELLAGLNLATDGGNWLIVDTPGQEAAIIEAMRDSGDLASFERIDLVCGQEALYGGGVPADELLQLLREEGYEVVACDEESDPDLPRWTLRRDPVKLENRELRQRLAARQAELVALKKKYDDLAKKCDELTKARDEQAKLASERQARIEELTKARDDLAKKRDELTKARDEQAKLAESRQKQIKELEARLASLAELEERQALLVEEMTRAEGQIDLIKDILLREPGL